MINGKEIKEPINIPQLGIKDAIQCFSAEFPGILNRVKNRKGIEVSKPIIKPMFFTKSHDILSLLLYVHFAERNDVEATFTHCSYDGKNEKGEDEISFEGTTKLTKAYFLQQLNNFDFFESGNTHEWNEAKEKVWIWYNCSEKKFRKERTFKLGGNVIHNTHSASALFLAVMPAFYQKMNRA